MGSMGMRRTGIGGWAAAVLFVTAVAPTAFAQDSLPYSRSTPAPVVSIPLNGGGMPPPQSGLRSSVLNLLQQVENLQSQVRKLRNQVEIQAHALQVMQQEQRNLIGDLNRRVTALETRSQASPAPAAGGASTGANTSTSSTSTSAGASTATAAPPGPGELKAYNGAFDLIREGFYDRAIAAFRAFIVKYPSSSLAGNAEYWIAEGHYVVGDYRRALKEYKKVLALYPNNTKVPDALLKVGYTEYELKSYDAARKTLTSVVSRFPNTTVATLATTRLDEMKKKGH